MCRKQACRRAQCAPIGTQPRDDASFLRLRLCLPVAPGLPISWKRKTRHFSALEAALGQAKRLACGCKVRSLRPPCQPPEKGETARSVMSPSGTTRTNRSLRRMSVHWGEAVMRRGLEVRRCCWAPPTTSPRTTASMSRWRSTLPIADLYRQTGRDAEGESVLRAATATSARDAGPRPLDNKASASTHGHS